MRLSKASETKAYVLPDFRLVCKVEYMRGILLFFWKINHGIRCKQHGHEREEGA